MDKEKLNVFRKKIRQLEREIFWELKQDSDCFGLTLSQCHTLLEIGKKEISIVDLSTELGTDPSTLSRTVNGMVNNGLVNRELNPTDRRYVSLTLTEKGTKLYDSINNFYNNYLSNLFKLIPKEKHEQVIESFIVFSDALKKSKEMSECCQNDNR